MELIIQFNKVTENLKDVFGNRSYNLAQAKKYVNVSNGFVLSEEIFRKFLENNNLITQISRYLDNLMVDNENIIPIVNAIQKAIINGIFPTNMEEEIFEYYESLSHTNIDGANDYLKNKSFPLVSVRNGVYNEGDSIYQLNVRGMDNLIQNIKILFASNFTSKKIINRKNKNQDLIEDGINPVIVQKMVATQRSGICYSYNPNINVGSESLVKAMFGLGIGKDDRKLSFDEYIVDKDYEIIDCKIGTQEYAYEKDLDSDNTVKYSLEENSTLQKLSESHIKEIVQTTRKLRRIFNSELIVEFGFIKNILMIFDVKPIKIDLEHVKDEEKTLFVEDIDKEVNDKISEQLEVVDIETNDLGFDIEQESDNLNIIEENEIIDESNFFEETDDSENQDLDLEEENIIEPQIEDQPYFIIEEQEEVIEVPIEENIFEEEPEIEVLTLDDLENLDSEEEINEEELILKEPFIQDDFMIEENNEEEKEVDDVKSKSDFVYNYLDDNQKIIEEEILQEKLFNQNSFEKTKKDYENEDTDLIIEIDDDLIAEEQEEVNEESNNFFSDLENENDKGFIFDVGEEENSESLFDEEETKKIDEPTLFEMINEDDEIEENENSDKEDDNEKEDSSDDFFSRIEVEDDGDFIFDETVKEDEEKDKKEDSY